VLELFGYKWIFDYNVVAALDPTYRKFLVDERESPEELEHNMLDPVCAPTGHLRTAYGHDYTGDEMEVIGAMGGAADNKRKKRARRRMEFNKKEEPTSPFAESVTALIDDIRTFGDSQDAASSEAEKEDEPEKFPKHLVIKPEYRNPPAAENPIPPERQLQPPKTVLGTGSKFYYPKHIFYYVEEDKYRDKAAVLVCRHKFSKSDDGKLRLIISKYRFDRRNNSMTEERKSLIMYIYNPKTKQMYKRTLNPKKIPRGPNCKPGSPDRHRWVGQLRNCGIDQRMMASIPDPCFQGGNEIVVKFLQELFAAVQADVPDAISDQTIANTIATVRKDDWYTQMEEIIYTIASTILKHKVGKNMTWLDKDTHKALVVLYRKRDIDRLLDDSLPQFHWEDGYDKAAKLRLNRIGKLVPKLQKHNNFRCAVETILGKWYTKATYAYLRVFSEFVNDTDLQTFFEVMHSKEVPRAFRHKIKRSLNAVSKMYCNDAALKLSYHFIDKMMDGANYFLTQQKHQDGKKRRARHFDSYIKFCDRVFDPANNKYSEKVDWHTWHDMMTMAHQLRIRLRPNKIKNVTEMQETHDKLSAIQRRDASILAQYSNTKFLPFNHPEELYGDGYAFVFLGSAVDLVHEGETMHHCVASYTDRCMRGSSIVFSVRKGDRSYITLELYGRDYSIVQKYTVGDNHINNEAILDMIDEWHVDLLDMHKDDEISYHEMCAEHFEQERMRLRKEAIKQFGVDLVEEEPDDGAFMTSDLDVDYAFGI
jgi:hypothetical protein